MTKYKKETTTEELDALNNALYQAGDDLFKEGKYKEALSEFDKALEAWPTDSYAVWAIGNCYSEMGKPEQAEEHFREALKNIPEKNKYDLIYNIGNALFDQRRFKEAIRLYEAIPKEHRTYKMARRNIRAAQNSIKRI